MRGGGWLSVGCKVSIIVEGGEVVVGLEGWGMCLCEDIVGRRGWDGRNGEVVGIVWRVDVVDKEMIGLGYKMDWDDIIVRRVRREMNGCGLWRGRR